MGLLSGLLSAAAPIVGTVFGGPLGGAIGGAVGGLLGSHDTPSSTTATNQQKLDPRIDGMLFGQNGSGGLLNTYQGYLNQPQSPALQGFGQAAGDYLTKYGAGDMSTIHDRATQMMLPAGTPLANAASTGAASANAASANTATADAASAGGGVGGSGVLWNKFVGVDAPAQNDMDLSGAYNRFVNGKPGANPYLDQSINGAIAQNRLGFQQLQSDATDNLQRNILPGIRSNSVLAGQYGGSRQGIAEGNALGDFGKAMASAANQFGQNATNAAVGAKANAYETDSNRALSATQGLGAQQYGVASQDAALGQASQFANQQAGNDASKFAASQVQNANQFNAGLQQQTNLFNAGQQQNTNQFNAGLQQQTNLSNAGMQQQSGLSNAGMQNQVNLANLQSQLGTNQLNNSAALGGAGLLGGLLDSARGTAAGQDNYAINRAQQVNGLLTPYLGATGSSTTTQPLYQNTGGGILGGALLGGQLGKMFGGSNLDVFGNNQSAGNWNGGLSLGDQKMAMPTGYYDSLNNFSFTRG